mgnify:CR=1 FL=1
MIGGECSNIFGPLIMVQIDATRFSFSVFALRPEARGVRWDFCKLISSSPGGFLFQRELATPDRKMIKEEMQKSVAVLVS